MTNTGMVQAKVINTITNVCSGAFGLHSPVDRPLFTNYDAAPQGAVTDVGTFAAGQALVFYLDVSQTGCGTPREYSTDSNWAHVSQLAPDLWQIEWEDYFQPGDDFDDLIVQVGILGCAAACPTDYAGLSIPGSAPAIGLGPAGTFEEWDAAGGGLNSYSPRSAGLIDLPIQIGKYLGPVDAGGHPAAGHSLYNKTVTLLIQGFDVDSTCSAVPCEQDSVTVNGVAAGQLAGTNMGFSTTQFTIPANTLVFRNAYLDQAGGVNHVRVAVDELSSTDRWFVGVVAVRLVLPPAPEIYRPTVLIHGWNGSAASLLRFSDKFQVGGVPAEAIKRVGHTSAPFPQGLYDVEAQVDPFIASTGWDRVNVVGHSLGGLYARAYAATHPDKVATVITMGTPSGGVEPAEGFCTAVTFAVGGYGCPLLFWQLTQTVVRSYFNPDFPDQPAIRYLAISGDDNNAGACTMFLPIGLYLAGIPGGLPNDSCVSVQSAEWMSARSANGGSELAELVPYHLSHPGLIEVGPVVDRVDCLLYHLHDGCEWPSAPAAMRGPSSSAVASFATAIGQEVSWQSSIAVPQGGFVDVPLVFEGTSRAAVVVLVPNNQVSATIGSTALAYNGSASIQWLNVILSQPSNQTMRITNSSGQIVTVPIVVSIVTDRRLILDSPSFVTRGMPLTFTVSIAGSLPGDTPTAKLVDPTGTATSIALTPAGTDMWTATITPQTAGTSRIVASLGGTKPRVAGTSLDVGLDTNAVSKSFYEWLDDPDGDGLADSLDLAPTITVSGAGTFTLVGHLIDGSGNEVGVARSTTTATGPGTIVMALAFDGVRIRDGGTSGPYRLVNLSLTDETGAPVTQALVPSAYYTASYALGAFEHAPIAFDPATFIGTSLDDNHDGIMDRWQVGGTIIVDGRGSYLIGAGLTSADGTIVATTTSTLTFMSGSNPFTVDFSGAAIVASGKPGPYSVVGFTATTDAWTQPLNSVVVSAPGVTVSTNAGVPIRASFPTGWGTVELWQRFKAQGGSTFGTWSQVATGPASNGSTTLYAPLANGMGTYELYSVAIDGYSGIREVVPPAADVAAQIVQAPSSSAGGLGNNFRNSHDFTLSYAASYPSGSGSVQLWQYGPSNWQMVATATSSPISVHVNSDGTYCYYTVAIDGGTGLQEPPPAGGTADKCIGVDTVAPASAVGSIPAAITGTSLSVPYTASDNTGGQGLGSVELWQRFQAAGSQTWSAWAVATTGSSSPLAVTLASGSGRYEFYTVAIDWAGNHEAPPAVADAFTVLTAPPATAAGPLAPTSNSTTLSVPFTATDATSIELWKRFKAAGSSTFSAWALSATSPTSPFSTSLSSGAGRYEFYTIGIKGAVREAAPASADAFSVLDTTAPTSTVGAVPSTSSATSLSVPFTAADNTNGTGMGSVELWARYRSSDAVSTGTWVLTASGTGTSGSITLPFASGAGIYDIATIAIDLAGNREGGLAQPSTAKSLVRAVSWAASVKVNTDTGTALQDNPACTIGPDGTAYCVWEDSRSGNADIYFAQRNPSTGVWSGELKLNADTGTKAQNTPAIAVDGSGNLYVAWADERNTTSTANTDIYFTKRNGTNWSANTKLNADATTSVQSQPRIAVSSAGIAVAVWLDLRSSQKNIYSGRLPAGSSTWSANFKVTSNTAATKGRPDVAVATDGTAHAVWEDATSGNADVDYATLGPTATTWSTNTKISDDSTSGAESYPRIGLTSANAPLVAWIDGRVTNKQVRVAQKSGSAWAASVQVSDASAKPASLTLAVKADGGVIAAWGDTRATSAIWGTQCEAGTSAVARCATAAKFNDQTGAAVNPAITASASTVYLGWSDSTAGGGDFRFSRRVPS